MWFENLGISIAPNQSKVATISIFSSDLFTLFIPPPPPSPPPHSNHMSCYLQTNVPNVLDTRTKTTTAKKTHICPSLSLSSNPVQIKNNNLPATNVSPTVLFNFTLFLSLLESSLLFLHPSHYHAFPPFSPSSILLTSFIPLLNS